MPGPAFAEPLTADTRAFYCRALARLNEAQAPFLVGGAYALGRYTGIERHTKDLDLFVRRRDFETVMTVLESAGCHTQLTFPHWLGKASCGDDFIDIIFSSGNAIATVDDEWFTHAVAGQVFDVPVRLCPAEEIIWSKAFIMERERFDGADILHLLRAHAAGFDWERLLRRFNSNWRVLFTHLLMFGYVYPAERAAVPRWVMDELLARLQREMHEAAPAERLCRGTIISREQYLIDIQDWAYRDARLAPHGEMTTDEIALWTEAIGVVTQLESGAPQT
jgi:hypothetical protein